MRFDKKEALPFVLIIIAFVISFYLYGILPEKIPIHWNAEGEIDGYGNKFWGLFLMPIVMLLIYLLITYIPKIAVYKENIKKFDKYIYGLKIAIIIFFFVLFILTLLPNFGYKINMTYFIMPAVAILFFYLGHIMKHLKRNYFIGIRTPWTLANENVWDKTHEKGEKVFKILAGIMIISLFFDKYWIWIFLIALFAAIAYLFVYSYLEYTKEVRGNKKSPL